jgi:hypothetical protein
MAFLIILIHSFVNALFNPSGPLTATLKTSFCSLKPSTCSLRMARMFGRPCRRVGGGTTRYQPSSLSSSSFSRPSQEMCEVSWTIQIRAHLLPSWMRDCILIRRGIVMQHGPQQRVRDCNYRTISYEGAQIIVTGNLQCA